MRTAAALQDGSTVLIRPIGPDDRDALAAGFERLSPESRYLRFLGPVQRLTDAQLRYLTDVDHHDHEALVAIDEQTGDLVGVARYIRTDGDVAEPAVAVSDPWQGRGLGSILLADLTERAREEGVQRFAALVLARNEAAMAALRRLGETQVTRRGREVELLVTLDEPAQASPTLQALLRGAAEQSVAPAVSFWHRLLARRHRDAGPPANVVVVGLTTAGAGPPPAVERAADLAAATGAAMHLVASRRLLLDDEETAREAEARLAAAAGALRDRGLAVEVHHRRGDLAALLLDVAGQVRARLIVVDATARTLDRLTGSVWDHVAHHAPCNVLVVR